MPSDPVDPDVDLRVPQDRAELVRSGHPLVALVYLGGTMIAALLAVVGGAFLVRRVVHR